MIFWTSIAVVTGITVIATAAAQRLLWPVFNRWLEMATARWRPQAQDGCPKMATARSLPQEQDGCLKMTTTKELPQAQDGCPKMVTTRSLPQVQNGCLKMTTVKELPQEQDGCPKMTTAKELPQAQVLYPEHKTAQYTTNHSLRRDVDETPAPYKAMPKMEEPEAEQLRKLFNNPVYLHQYAALGHQLHGPVFRDCLGGPVELVFVSDSDAVPALHAASGRCPGHVVPEPWTLYLRVRDRHRGLFFMDGQEWLDHRRLLNQRLLRPNNLKHHCEDLGSNTRDLMTELWQLQQQYGSLRGSQLILPLYKWALESICVIALGRRIAAFDCHSDPECKFETFVEAIHNIFRHTVAMGQTPASEAMEQQTEAWCQFVASCDTALDIASRYTKEAIAKSRSKKQQDEPNLCLLDQLLHEDDINDEMIVRLIADLFLAASDTTVWATTWLLCVVGQQPAVAEAARQQITEVHPVITGDGGRLLLQQEDLRKLTHCRNIMKETLRLYPVAPFVTRLLAKDCALAGYSVPANTMAILSVYSIGRDPEYFTDPQTFNPQRWARDSSADHEGAEEQQRMKNMQRMVEMPWGIGSRNCVGRTVAETMLVLFLAHLLRNFKVRTLNKEIHMKLQMISVPSEELNIEISPLFF